jgi:uncharacterized protein with HEPN domain
MLDSAQKIIQYAGVGRQLLLEDELRQDALIRQITILGEAAYRLGNRFCETHDHIPWSDIIGMRHRVVHGYDAINWDVVWNVTAHFIPNLIPQLEQLRAQLEER